MSDNKKNTEPKSSSSESSFHELVEITAFDSSYSDFEACISMCMVTEPSNLVNDFCDMIYPVSNDIDSSEHQCLFMKMEDSQQDSQENDPLMDLVSQYYEK